MEENFKNKLGFFAFFFLVVFLAVGGFFFTNYLANRPEDNKVVENNSEKTDYRIDKNKEYIYFVNDKVISESAEIYTKDVVINLSTQSTLNESLEKENKIFNNNIKYLDETELLTDELITYNNDNLYALTYREYKTFEYNNYISLVLEDYNYSCFDLSTFIGTKGYIFDTNTGKLLSNDEVLDMYNLNIEGLKELIKEYLNKKQQVVDEQELIKIDDTINNLNYSLYINEYGRLYVSYLVKTTKVDYNEIMEV